MSNKSRIESVAHKTVQRTGLKSLSFRTLGAEVGVKSSSVHYHFPEKSDLAEALINRFRNDFLKSLHDLSEQSPTAQASIRQFSQIFVEQYNKKKMCFTGMMAAEVENLSDANRKSLNALIDGVHVWLTAEFERAADEVTVNLPASTLANSLFASLQGALLMDRAQDSDAHLAAVNSLIDSWFAKTN